MSKILVPSCGPSDWKQFLAQPEVHWAKGYSARTLAHSWEDVDTPPSEVLDLMEQAFGPAKFLFGVPEHKTPLPGGSRESQSDVFALMRHQDGLATYTIEGKVDEPFGPTVEEWSANASAGKIERLAYLTSALGISACPPDIRYQLLHRTVSALIEADRFDAKMAGMIVHSFSPELKWFDEFSRFAELLGCKTKVGEAAVLKTPSGMPLMVGWASGDQRFREN
jgi:hypothetical protein